MYKCAFLFRLNQQQRPWQLLLLGPSFHHGLELFYMRQKLLRLWCQFYRTPLQHLEHPMLLQFCLKENGCMWNDNYMQPFYVAPKTGRRQNDCCYSILLNILSRSCCYSQ